MRWASVSGSARARARPSHSRRCVLMTPHIPVRAEFIAKNSDKNDKNRPLTEDAPNAKQDIPVRASARARARRARRAR